MICNPTKTTTSDMPSLKSDALPGRPYDAAAYAIAPSSPVFWQAAEVGQVPAPFASLGEDLSTEVLVIGAGYAGLTCARRLAAEGREVCLVDTAGPGWGASGRNGGFCCIGGDLHGPSTIARRWGEGDALHYTRTQREAIDFVAELLFEAGLSDMRQGHGEVRLAHHPRVASALKDEALKLDFWYGVKAELLDKSDLLQRGLNVSGVFAGLYYPLGFGVQPWQYSQALAALVIGQGARVYADTPVISLRQVSGQWQARTPAASVTAKTIVIATNGYSSDLIPDWLAGRYLPVLSQVMVTRPLTDAEIEAQGFSSDIMSYDSRRLLHYFRLLPDRRFLFGMRGGLKAAESETLRAQSRIRRHFDTLFPAWAKVPHEYQWNGLVCLNSHGLPYVGGVPGLQNMYAAFGWHGNGVAMASYGGHLLANAIIGEKNHIPAVMQRIPKALPFAPYRRRWLGPAYAASWLLDRFGR